MTKLLIAPTCATPAHRCGAQTTKPESVIDRSELATSLSFEASPKGDTPGGWGGGPAGTIFADTDVVHSGRGSARIERLHGSPGSFSTITTSIAINFSGKTIELRGFLRTEEVSNFVGLWMREDDESTSVAFDNMQGRQLKGTIPWTEYSISLPLHPEARQLFFGALLTGTGKAWVDDLELLVDGKQVWDVPFVDRPKTVLDLGTL